MKKYFVTALAALILLPLLQACWKDSNNPTKELTPSLPTETYRYANVELPEHLGGSVMKDLGVTDDGANLGRVLFYDKKLSLNNRIACGSCHFQSHAFSDVSAFSEGFEGKMTPRNSMPIINPVLNATLFWDARSSSVEDLTLRPIQNHIEMGIESLTMLEDKLEKTSYYPSLFEKAFGTKDVTSERIRSALSQFLRTMVSGASKYDEAILANDLSSFNSLEKLGYQLFISSKTQCGSCHSEPSFSATSASKSNVAGFGVNVFNDNPSLVLNDPTPQQNPNPYMGTITDPNAPQAGSRAKGTTNIGLN
ncbi:MAG: cytochrome-c peroxidase, partial [Bacteroidia bacterium]